MTMFGSLAFQIAALTLIFAAFTYGCIIADPETSDVARFCTRTIPSFLLKQIERLIGQKQLSKLEKCMERGLQIVYLVIVLGSWSIIFTYGYEAIDKSNHISNGHKYAGYVVFAMCMSSWHYACTARPGEVTSRTMPLFDHYKYDDILYTNRECPTLKIRKIARSKFDRCTQRHVPRFDHYCGWLCQAVGEQNYRWFLLFLIVHVFMCMYGSWAMGTVLFGEVVDKNLLNATFFNPAAGTEVKGDYIIVMHYLSMRYFEVVGVMLLMTVMGACLGVFLGFHLYITSRNMTTNEFFKWRAVRKFHKKETRKYQQALKNGIITNATKVNGDAKLQVKDTADVNVVCTGPVGEAAQKEVEDDNGIFDPGPMPEHIYNKGIVANFIEVFKPLSFREEAIQRYITSLKDEAVRSQKHAPERDTEKAKTI